MVDWIIFVVDFLILVAILADTSATKKFHQMLLEIVPKKRAKIVKKPLEWV